MDLNTPTASKLVGALSLLAAAALGWVFLVGPETAAVAETRELVETARQQNQALQAQLSQMQDQRDELRQTRLTARELTAKFPPTADQPGLFEAVTAAAVDAGIGPEGLTTLAPTPPVIGDASGGVTAGEPAPGSGQLASQTVAVSVTGTYDQTQQLLENLEQMERAYLITSVSLAGGEEGGVGSFTTTISGGMFVMPPVADPGSDVDVDAASATN